MKRSLLLVMMLFTVLCLSAEIRVISKNASTLTVEYSLDHYELQEFDNFLRLYIPQANYPETSGAPSLPTLEFKIGVPPAGDASFRVLSSSSQSIQLSKPILPVPYLDNGEKGSLYRYEADAALYRSASSTLISSQGLHRYRSQGFIPFLINPVQYDGALSLQLTNHAIIEISISGNLEAKSPPANDSMTGLLLDQLLNAEDARYWQHHTRQSVHYADFSRSPWWIRIETDKKGIYRINQSQLSSLPLNEIDPRSFRLFSSTGLPISFAASAAGNEFKEVPIRVVGESDGSFDAADYIVFYGGNREGWKHNQSISFGGNMPDPKALYHNPYSQNYVYWLTFAGDFDDAPLRIQEISGTGTPYQNTDSHIDFVHYETESQRRSVSGLVWHSDRLFGSSTADYHFDIDLPDLLPSDNNTLILRLQQEDIKSEQYHTINVFVNNVPIQSSANSLAHRWYSTSRFDFSKNSSAFVPGTNRITIRVIRGNYADNLFLDYIRVEYRRKLTKGSGQYMVNALTSGNCQYNFTSAATGVEVYQVNDDYTVYSLLPSQVGNALSFAAQAPEGSRFWLSRPDEMYSPALLQRVQPNDISQIDGAIHTLIVSPDLFMNQANQLADFYLETWGYNARVVNVNDIFTQFNGGHPEPAAIRQYVKYLYHNAPEPKLQALTLLGLGTLDWRNYSRAAASKNLIPIYYSTIQSNDDPILSDDYFGMINTVTYPEIAIGRYPVSKKSELDIMLNNLYKYVKEPQSGLWRNSLVSLADDYRNGTNINDLQHTRDLEALCQSLNPAVYNDKIFAEEWEYDQFLNKPKVRDELIRQINSGKLMFYYIGHGSFDSLGAEDYLSVVTDMHRLKNPDHLPLFIAASCEISQFEHWAFESLGQKSVILENRGMIASVAAASKSFPDPNHRLMMSFIPAVLDRNSSLGENLSYAKLRHTQSTINDERYFLLGDPNLIVAPPKRISSLQLTDGAEEGTLHSRAIAKLAGDFDVEALDGIATISANDSPVSYLIRSEPVSKMGNKFFSAPVSVANSAFAANLLVPDDIFSGNKGLITSYFWDEVQKQDYLSYYYPLSLSTDVLPGALANDGPPQISLYLDSMDFRAGDTVGQSPTLYAKISDANGINIAGKQGHDILLVLDNSLQPISVTQYFEYDLDSYTQGFLTYPLSNLSEGNHTLQLIAFDSYNLPAVENVSFISKKSSGITLEKLLIYPNPVQTDAHITFIVSDNAEVNLDVFTLSGRRIRSIKQSVPAGFQKIYFDGRDAQGKKLANNTYFIRVRAKNAAGKSVEKRERMVIYK